MAVNRVSTSKRASARQPESANARRSSAGESALARDISRDDVREVLWLIADVVTGLKRGAHEIPEQCRTPFEGGQLGPRHVPVLMTVAFMGELSVSHIAERIGLSLATTSLMVGELAREGLVQRSEDERDRRRTIVRLHDDYRAVMDAWAQERFAPVGRALARMSPTAYEHFLDGLRMVAEETRAQPARDAT
jgi:DNA-binding MarR family transcriptional regulator